MREDDGQGLLSSYLESYIPIAKKPFLKFIRFNYADSRSYRYLWENPYHKHRISLAIGIVLLFLIYALLTSVVYPERRSQLSAYSSGWNDIRDFRKALEDEGYDVRSIQSSPIALKDYFNKDNTYQEDEENEDGDTGSNMPPGEQKLSHIFGEWNYDADLSGTVLAVIGVERKYTADEVKAIESYVWQGGNLLIADDFGYGNVFGKEFDMGFSKDRLYDKNYNKNTAFVEATATTPYGSYDVILDAPSTLRNVERTHHIMDSSSNSFIDLNKDGREDTDEDDGAPFPLCIMDGYGAGQIMMVSDPGLFINDMLRRPGYENEEFALDLVRMLLPSGGEVIFDESVHIPPGYLSNGVSSFLTSIYIVKTNIIYNVILMIIVVIVVELAVFGVKNPIKLFRPRPMRNQASNVRYLKKNLTTRNEIRRVFIDKVRVEMGMSQKDFSQLSKKEVARLIGNNALSRFLFDPDYVVEPGRYGPFVEQMEQWFLMP